MFNVYLIQRLQSKRTATHAYDNKYRVPRKQNIIGALLLQYIYYVIRYIYRVMLDGRDSVHGVMDPENHVT